MFNWWRQRTKAKDVAKDRLRVVLMQDRLSLSHGVMEEMKDEVQITVIATGFGEDDKEPVDAMPSSSSQKVVTKNGLEGKEVTLDDLLKENSDNDDDNSDSKFVIPSFLNK